MSCALLILMQEKLLLRTVYHKIAQPCPEQGDLGDVCTVQLPCCSHVVQKRVHIYRHLSCIHDCGQYCKLTYCMHCRLKVLIVLIESINSMWLAMCMYKTSVLITIPPCLHLPHRRAWIWHCTQQRSGTYSRNSQSLLIDRFACGAGSEYYIM